MIKLTKTNSDDEDFKKLVIFLDKELQILDGAEYEFYSQFNKTKSLKFVIIASLNNIPVGCGAIKNFDKDSMEVKRMFVLPEFRGKGIATKILVELENWARELLYSKCVLETGKRQPSLLQL